MSRRTGSATVLVVFLTAALMLIASAVWRGAGANFSDALTSAAVLQARLAAESAIRRTVAAAGALPAIPAGHSAALPGVVLVPSPPSVRATVVASRLSPELYRIEATGMAGQPAAFSSVAFLYWQLDPGSRLRALPAVAAIGGSLILGSGGSVTGASVTGPPPPWGSGQCSSVQALADSIFPSGSAPSSTRDTTAALALGLLDQAALFQRAGVVVGGGTPAPRTAGGSCVTSDHWNWGSPSNPVGPCGSHRPVIASRSHLLVSGGEGQGVLIVDGNVHLTSGARYFGVVLASGTVQLDQGARVDGFVRADGDLSIGPGSSVHGSACAALFALRSAVLKPAAAVPTGWVDPF